MQTKRKATLADLVQELQAETLQKRDFVLPASCMSMRDGKLIITNHQNIEGLEKILKESGIGFSSEGGEIQISQMELSCLDVMNNHLADKLQIPSRYYKRMMEGHTTLLDQNVSYWFKTLSNNFLLRCFVDKDEKRGFARALLSDSFKVIDNLDILLAVLAAVKESGLNITIDEDGCDLSEKRMYVRFVCKDVEIKAPELLRNYRPNGQPNTAGDGIISGFVITNSEVGLGSLTISPRAKILACSNGLIGTNENFRKTHLGAKMGEYETIQWSGETKEKNLELIISQVKDAIKYYVSEEYLGKRISEVIQLGSKELEHPMDAIKAVSNELMFSEEKANDLLNIFIKSGDMINFGIVQSLTLYANTKADADTQYELEQQAVQVLENMSQYDKPLPKKSTKTQEKLN